MGTLVVCWGIIMTMVSFAEYLLFWDLPLRYLTVSKGGVVQNFGGLVAVRFLLGIFE
jgi:hypothetical protein